MASNPGRNMNQSGGLVRPHLTILLQNTPQDINTASAPDVLHTTIILD